MRITHTVIKNDDLAKYHTKPTIEFIERAGAAINERRLAEGLPINQYIVVNTDEPFIDEIIDVLKRNGKWG